MYSKHLIKKLANDTPLNNMHDCLLTYDITPFEKLKRSIVLTDFWVENRRQYYKLYKSVYITFKGGFNSIIKFGYLLLQFKAICDGKEPTCEIAGSYNLIALEEILKVVKGIE